MDDDGPRHLPRERKLIRKGASLFRTGRIVVMVIESTFTDRYGTAGDEFAEAFDVAPRLEADCIVWMHAGREPHVTRVFACNGRRRASGAEDIPGAAAGADADDRCGSALLRALNYLAAVAVERRVGEVRVTVDVPLETEVFLGHFLSIQRSVGPAM